jgi:uncharacterized membrane protein YphA (DoxX/SURF4 family)
VTLDPAVVALIVACMAVLFAGAAIHKLRDLRRFDEIFTAYGLIPLRAQLRLSLVVPVLEALVAVGLVFDLSRKVALCVGILLLLGYAIAIAWNLSRGRRDLACGCGGPDDRRPIAAWMVWRNILIAAAAALTLLPWSPRSLGLTDVITVGFGAVACSLIYLCLDRLLSHTARLSAALRVSQ